MRNFQPIGLYADIVEARSPADPEQTVRLGLARSCLEQNLRRMFSTAIAQYYGIVQDGMVNAVHLFQGIKRPLMSGNDKDVDKSVLVYTWRPESDFVGSGGQFDNWRINPKVPPLGRVFVVLVRPESQPTSYPFFQLRSGWWRWGMVRSESQPADSTGEETVFGSIEKWNWVKEDPFLPNAPIDWKQRYEKKLWSRGS
jgi:hypothetical protein